MVNTMEKFFAKLKIGIFMAVLVLPGVIWYGVSVLSPETVAEWDFDLGENRAKAELPTEIWEADFTQKLEAYYNDNVPFRSALIDSQRKLTGSMEAVYTNQLQARLSELFYGKQEDTSMDIGNLIAGGAPEDTPAQDNTSEPPETVAEENREHSYAETVLKEADCVEAGEAEYVCAECGDSYREILPVVAHTPEVVATREADYLSYGYTDYRCLQCGLEYRGDFQGKLIDNSYLAPTVKGDGVLLGRFDWLFYTGNTSIQYYRGSNILEEEKMAEYLGLMQQLQDICDEKGIQLAFMIMPNREQVYPEYMPTYEIVDSYKRVDRFADYVQENSELSVVYPLEELKAAELYWQTHYKYDTHWNNVGAYIGTQALYENLGMETISLHDVEKHAVDAQVRGLIALGGLDSAKYPPDVDYVIDYRPEVNILSATKGDKLTLGVYYTTSDSTNDKKMVMLADSFRVFMIDYLAKDFSKTVIAHRDYIESLHESIQSADVLVIAAVERYDNRMFPTIERVIEILSE